MSLALDLIVIALLAICIFGGYRKGLIMGVARVLIVVIAILVAGVVARDYSPGLAENIEPYIGWLSEDAVDQVVEKAEVPVDQATGEQAFTIIRDSFLEMGISQDTAENLAQKAQDIMDSTTANLRKSISKVFTEVLTYVFIFVIVFAVAAALLLILVNIVTNAFALPGFALVDKIAGSALGLVYGLCILFVVCWLLRYCGIFIPDGILEDTVLVKFFMNFNPLQSLLGL